MTLHEKHELLELVERFIAGINQKQKGWHDLEIRSLAILIKKVVEVIEVKE